MQTIKINSEDTPKVFPLFQKGIFVKIRTGCSLQALLCDILEIPKDYVLKRISTIFLDGKPVDRLDTALICSNSVVSLSAAMPGLVGAVMRREGVLASFRETISYRANSENIGTGEGLITIKLFNMLISELSGHFLQKGFWVMSSDIRDILSDYNVINSEDDQDMVFLTTNL